MRRPFEAPGNRFATGNQCRLYRRTVSGIDGLAPVRPRIRNSPCVDDFGIASHSQAPRGLGATGDSTPKQRLDR